MNSFTRGTPAVRARLPSGTAAARFAFSSAATTLLISPISRLIKNSTPAGACERFGPSNRGSSMLVNITIPTCGARCLTVAARSNPFGPLPRLRSRSTTSGRRSKISLSPSLAFAADPMIISPCAAREVLRSPRVKSSSSTRTTRSCSMNQLWYLSRTSP
ncbi:unannotated protein [freshwater metagenome]|uniref:Unannotated protein n=1 Tax=freshwater metagenome TaxID=449393 RepID=A0A6J7TTS4_9ZZZZ